MKLNILFLILLLSCISPTWACELCSIFNSIDNQERQSKNFFVGLAYQNQISSSNAKPDFFSQINRNAEKQEIDSNTTQFMANYFFTNSFSLQINIPFIYRKFRRFDGNSYVNGRENGIGDASFLVKYIPFQDFQKTVNYRIEFFTGLKLPTGNSDRLSEVLEDPILPSFQKHGGPAGSLVGGDDLTLGSGSYDVIFGNNFYLQQARFHLQGNFQYTLKTEGDFNYEFGDDLQWALSPGYYLFLDHSYTTALRLRFSGEYKFKDKLENEKLENSDEFNIFLGPELVFSFYNNSFLQISHSFVLKNDDSNNEVAAKQRFFASFVYRF